MDLETTTRTVTTIDSDNPCFPTPSKSLYQRLRNTVSKVTLSARIEVPNYVWCAIYTAIGGFLFGFDTGSIGPITIMPKFQEQFAEHHTGTISPTVQGLLVSSILLTASLASLISGPLSDRISRVRTISLGAIVFSAGSAIACSANTLVQMFIGRCIAGIGEGLFLSAITVYAIEISPASSRGRLGSIVQLLITIGIATGYFVCYGTSRINSSLSWRFPLGMQAVVSSILAVGSPFLPHSPRWLRHVGRGAEADATWLKLGVSAADAEKSEENAQRAETVSNKRESWWKEAQQLWKKDIRKRTSLGVFLMAMQNASGIDGVLYYAPVLFQQAGLSGTTASFIASGVSGLVNVACTIGVQFFADTWGRRVTMIGGGSVIASSMLIIGTLYATGASNTEVGRWAIIVLIYIFVVGFSCSWAIVTRIICSEIQPMRTRAAATSLGQCANWVLNWMIAFSTPLFLAHSSSGPYFLFGTCSLLTTFVCIAFQPETRGASLEEVEQAFLISPWKAALAKRRLRQRQRQQQRARGRSQTEQNNNDIDEGDRRSDIEIIQLPELTRNQTPQYNWSS
ncbi:major facilitator superfamily protein [Abortiporus biennis]